MNHKETFAVLGLSTFGCKVAVSLYKSGATVIAIDKKAQIVNKIASDVTKALAGDLMEWELLEHAGVLTVDTVVIGLRHSFDVAVLLTCRLKNEAKIKRIIVQVDTEEKAAALKMVGADMIVFPERDIADRLTKRLVMGNLVDHIPLSQDVSIVEVPAPEVFENKSLKDLQIRSAHKIHVIAIKKHIHRDDPGKMDVAPEPDHKISKGDTLLLLGNTINIDKFITKYENK